MENAHTTGCNQGLQNIYYIIFLVQSEQLNTNTKFNLYKPLIRFVMTYSCPAWEFAADTHLMKLQRLQNSVLPITGKFTRSRTIRDMHMAFKIPYVYDYITKLCRIQARHSKS
jgi:hypothetical protein